MAVHLKVKGGYSKRFFYEIEHPRHLPSSLHYLDLEYANALHVNCSSQKSRSHREETNQKLIPSQEKALYGDFECLAKIRVPLR